jgi:hypothetical protein
LDIQNTAAYSLFNLWDVSFRRAPGLGVRGVSGFLLPSDMFKPAFHSQCRYAVLPVKDDLPHFKGLPASFGGSDETVGW